LEVVLRGKVGEYCELMVSFVWCWVGLGWGRYTWLSRIVLDVNGETDKAMLLTRDIMALPRPSNDAIKDAMHAFCFRVGDSPAEGSYFNHHTSSVHDEADLSSLVTPPPHLDPLTRFFLKFTTSDSSGSTVTHLVSFLSVICAVVFLVGAMVGLYLVPNVRVRLGMVAVFTCLFAGTIAVAAGTRRQEVFVATAA
jgi:hypothetical protein